MYIHFFFFIYGFTNILTIFSFFAGKTKQRRTGQVIADRCVDLYCQIPFSLLSPISCKKERKNKSSPYINCYGSTLEITV